MIETFAPAKVNLALHITGQRDDGYHLLDSLVVFPDIGDTLRFEEATARKMTVTGPFAGGVPTGPENLIWQAVDLLAPGRPLSITLEKNLPHGAGIGGGSSDAAATLSALSEAWALPLPDPAAILGLGADVPVCVAVMPARMSGIGERLAPAPKLPDCAILLVNPRKPVSTGPVFKGLQQKDNPPMPKPSWSDFDGLISWLGRTRNDLQPPAIACEPMILEVLATLSARPGCALSRMSGSGSTCFGLYASAKEAHLAAREISKQHPDWWVRATTLRD
ncbi:MAG: 4-(cytidine 5'-diphospho)-2-C-methyl-D-erythritol kinase [Pseudomonadota bacterium]